MAREKSINGDCSGPERQEETILKQYYIVTEELPTVNYLQECTPKELSMFSGPMAKFQLSKETEILME